MDNRNTSSSSSSQQQNQTEEETTNFYRPQLTPRNSSKNNIVIERLNVHGIPLKPSAVVAIQENREREKRELSQLNNRFASYIERVGFLEIQNKKLQLEIDHLRGKWGSKTNKIKEKYDIEIHQARHIIDETTKDRAAAELRANRAEEETSKLKNKYKLLLAGRDSDRSKIEFLQKQLFNNEADLELLHRRLIDLEDEQKRSYNKSQELILDIQRIRKDLDAETIARIQMENEKQTLEEEIHFLKEIHSQEIEELKQIKTLNPTNFFQNQLSNAVKNIRQEYEQLNQQQQNELQSWYQLKVTEAIKEIQSHRNIEKSKNLHEQEEIKKLRTLVSDSQQDIVIISRRNEGLQNRIRELEEVIQIERNNNIRASNERDYKIKDLRIRLENLGRNYDELITTKSSLDSEIFIYRKLLEGEEKREGLKQIITNIPTTYSRSNQGFSNNDLMLTSYQPHQSLSSSGRESTIFEQVYGGHRRWPTAISSNVQWLPAVDRSSTYRWNTSDINNRKLKKRTFFDTGAMREQQQPKAVTPPSSDYTDAYLSAFAPKPFPTKRIYRIMAPAFANVAPIRTLLSTNNSIRTSQTHSNKINSIHTSNSFDLIEPSLPSSSSIYSSSVIPDICPKYEPLSSTQSSLPETQTYNSNNSTSLHNRQPPETTIYTSPQPSSSTVPTIYQSESPHENVCKRTPSSSATSLSSSSTKFIYKPSVSFQSAPLSFSNNAHHSSTNERTVLPSSNTVKHIDRPETLVFQHDEDIRSPCIEKPSPIITPLLESPITRVESKIEPERTSTEELSTISSKPIKILEKTMNKYDTIIDQISEILASVSPLSSTISSMSSGKSVLDYELTSDGSPILPRKRIEPQTSEQSTTPVKNTSIQRGKGKYLIRDDSYDKIVNAIADLDNELTPPPEIEKSTTTVIEEEKEEPITPSLEDHQMTSSSSSERLKDEDKTLSFDKDQTPSLFTEKEKETEIIQTNEQQRSSVTKGEESDLSPFNETKLDVESIIQTPSNNDELTSNKKNEKHVTWGEILMNNEDDESSSSESLTEEIISSEISVTSPENERLISDESTTAVEQQISTPTSVENVVVDDQVDSPTSTESSVSDDQNVISTDFTKVPTIIIQRQTESASSPERSPSFSDSVDRQTTTSDINESQSSCDEQRTGSVSSGDPQFIFDVNEQSTTSSKVISEEIEANKTETPVKLVDVTENEAGTSTIKNTDLLSLPIIESPIDTLANSISTRYISSDVYHGYLGDHTQFIESPSDIDNENKKISLLVSLRQTIETPATPLIETIQSVVSCLRILTALQPLINENGVTDCSQNEIRLTTALVTDSNEHETQIEENNPTAPALEESKTTFESLRDTITEPIQTIVSNLQTDKQDAPSIQTQRTEEAIVASLPLDPLHEESIDNNLHASVTLPSEITKVTLANEDKEQIVSDTDTIIVKSPSSEYINKSEDNTTGSNMSSSIVEDDQQVLTTNNVSSEQIDNGNKEEVTQVDFALETSDVTIFEEETGEIKTHPLTTITEKIDSVISSSPTEENLSLIKQYFAPTNNHTDTEQVISTETIQDQSSPSQENEQILILEKSEFSPDNKIPDITSTNVLSQVSDDGITQSTTPQRPSAVVARTDNITTTEKIDTQITPTNSLMTELTLTSEIDESTSVSNNENQIIQKILDALINNIIQPVIPQNSMETNQEILSSDSALAHSIIPQTFVQLNIENIPSIDFLELSPTNTEPNSFELIHALRGHSIVLPNSSEQFYHPPEKSPSTTTSSQITSSDRYVSYAIHQMGDSSQERLPAFPLEADIPIQKNLIVFPNQAITKEDDSTEFDATDNLTSYTDDMLLQRLQTSAINRQKKFDISSTDDDVDDEIEQHDLTDLEHIIDKLIEPDNSLNTNTEPYQRYDLAKTSSSNESSLSSRLQTDDIYFIPGYSGLWRPSSDNDSANLLIDYDADDERKPAYKTRTIVKTLSSIKRPLSFETQPRNLTSDVPYRPDAIDISESDSYQTCPSSISKQTENNSKLDKTEEEHQASPDENIFLICQRERGTSLPITMKIDCDDMALRLSTSSPLYSTLHPDLSSSSLSSIHSEPLFPIKTDSNSRSSSPSSSNHEQNLPSWLNTINTITTTTDGPLESRITLLKSAKGPISISECHPEGNYIIIENISQSKNIDLTNWKIQQENDNGDNLIFIFPDHCLLRPNHSLKILTKTNQSEQRYDDLIASSISSWHTGPNIFTVLINPEGKECATLTKNTISS